MKEVYILGSLGLSCNRPCCVSKGWLSRSWSLLDHYYNTASNIQVQPPKRVRVSGVGYLGRRQRRGGRSAAGAGEVANCKL